LCVGQVFEAQGDVGEKAAAEQMSPEKRKFHHALSGEGVLMQHDQERSCLLRHIVRKAMLRLPLESGHDWML
jgi:hypothetical protein